MLLSEVIKKIKYLLSRSQIPDTGMSADQISTIFSRFKSRTGNRTDGTGIGLAIAKSVADFHGIEIGVDSVVMKGTSFSFTFPENS